MDYKKDVSMLLKMYPHSNTEAGCYLSTDIECFYSVLCYDGIGFLDQERDWRLFGECVDMEVLHNEITPEQKIKYKFKFTYFNESSIVYISLAGMDLSFIQIGSYIELHSYHALYTDTCLIQPCSVRTQCRYKPLDCITNKVYDRISQRTPGVFYDKKHFKYTTHHLLANTIKRLSDKAVTVLENMWMQDKSIIYPDDIKKILYCDKQTATEVFLELIYSGEFELNRRHFNVKPFPKFKLESQITNIAI